MESVLKSYNLNNEGFFTLMKSTGAIIAGSAALAALNNDFTPDDIDIWVHTDRFKNHSQKDEGLNKVQTGTDDNAFIFYTGHLAFELYFLNNGYKYSQTVKPKNKEEILTENSGYSDGPMSKVIKHIMRYENSDGKKVQVIHTCIPVLDAVKTFDLSICATWCEFKEYKPKVYTYDPVNTLQKIMYPLRNDFTERENIRVAKYQSRGYILKSDYIKNQIQSLVNQNFAV